MAHDDVTDEQLAEWERLVKETRSVRSRILFFLLRDAVRAERAENGRLREALQQIAHSKHSSYDNGYGGQYGIGVADGHRCAAKAARLALGETVHD